MSPLQRLTTFLQRQFITDESADTQLTEQFLITLRSLYLKLEAKRQRDFRQSPETSRWDEEDLMGKDPTTQRISELFLRSKPDWTTACEIELLLLYLFDDAALDAELGRRLVEAQSKLTVPMYESYQSDIARASLEGKRAILGRLVSDLQWYQTVTNKMFSYKRQATTYTSALFLIAFALFVMALYMFDLTLMHSASNQVILMVISTGFWGATFSMLLGTRKQLQNVGFNELRLMRKLVYQVARSMVGVGAAAILFFFIQTKFVSAFASSNVLPDLNRRLSAEQSLVVQKSVETIVASEAADWEVNDVPGFQDLVQKLVNEVNYAVQVTKSDIDRTLEGEISRLLILLYPDDAEARETARRRLSSELSHIVHRELSLDPRSLALLIVWSFLAGFSEKLVPSMLSKTEEKMIADEQAKRR